MDGDCSKKIQLNECANGVDRISQLPNEILFLILSLLPVRKAASTTVLSSRWLNLWKEIPNLKFNIKSDRISQLPDHIVLFILSFLRLRAAAATSVLSSRWLDLWKHRTCLNFDDFERYLGAVRGLSDEEFIEVVNSIIQSHKALSLKSFRISFHVKESDKCAVTKWLEFVFSRKVKNLILDFRCPNALDKVVLKESLRDSRICGAPQDLIFFKSLERLCLGSLVVNGEDIKLFLRNCPLLEELIINNAVLMSDLEVRGTTDLMLKRLEIYYCKGESSITVSAPNLTWIEFSSNTAKLLFENVPRLAGASFQSADPDFVHQFANIPQLQNLYLTFSCPVMAPWMDGFPQMLNLRTLHIVCYDGYNDSLLLIIALIWASPRLERFSFKNCGDDPQVPGVLTNGERSKHQNLQVFEFQMSSDQSVSDHIVELVIYILDNCAALREVIIRRQGWYPGGPITAEMRADANDLQQKLQGKVANNIRLQLFGCDIAM